MGRRSFFAMIAAIFCGRDSAAAIRSPHTVTFVPEGSDVPVTLAIG